MGDPFVRRVVVVGLIVIALCGMGLGGVLSYQDKGVPDFIIAVTSAALAGLTGILVRTPDDGSF